MFHRIRWEKIGKQQLPWIFLQQLCVLHWKKAIYIDTRTQWNLKLRRGIWHNVFISVWIMWTWKAGISMTWWMWSMCRETVLQDPKYESKLSWPGRRWALPFSQAQPFVEKRHVSFYCRMPTLKPYKEATSRQKTGDLVAYKIWV